MGFRYTPSGGLPPRDPSGKWDATLAYLERLLFHMESGRGPDANQRREIAQQLREMAPTMIGPMPYRIEAFIESYGESSEP